MGNSILNFLQEQGILIVMGLMVLEGMVHQWVASRRYRRLRTGLQALPASHGAPQERGQAGSVNGMTSGSMTETAPSSRKKSRRANRRQEVGRSAPDIVTGLEGRASRRQPYEGEAQMPSRNTVHNQLQENVAGNRGQESSGYSQSRETGSDLDAQLLYLKQSLDRIAAGRDQKWEEEPREHRKLTPEQEAIIAEILREYLS